MSIKRVRKRITNLIAAFRNEIAVYRSVLSDPLCPRAGRWLLGGAIAYALSPIDLIPDFIPIVGHLDDAVILPLLIWLAFKTIPKDLVIKHRQLVQSTAQLGSAKSPFPSST